MILQPRFNQQDAERAHDEWGANCGPAAIAAVMDMTLDEVRPYLGDFERRGYINPTMMVETLDRCRAAGRFKRFCARTHPHHDLTWPKFGVAGIQWEGPWMAPDVPVRARYRHRHWVGSSRYPDEVAVFDLNCLNNGTGWVSLSCWSDLVVPWLLKNCVPRANGKWHLTHTIEIGR